jgi:hypothetical protein
MTLEYLFILALLLAIVFAAGISFAVRRRLAPRRLRVLDGLRERAAGMRAEPPSTQKPQPSDRWPRASRRRAARTEGAAWAISPDLQPAQTLHLATSALTHDWPPGLTVTAMSAGVPGHPQQEVYYVQRNVIALARGLNATEADRRAAALTLSAVMTSRLGRASDPEQALRDGALAANRLVRSISGRSPEYSDMVTTLDVVFASFDGDRPLLHFAHVGNSSIWLQRAGSSSVESLTESDAIDGGPVLRAVGLGPDLMPDIGHAAIDIGDRIFLTTASPYFAFTGPLMESTAGSRADQMLYDVVAELAEAVNSSSPPGEIMILGAEAARPGLFLA